MHCGGILLGWRVCTLSCACALIQHRLGPVLMSVCVIDPPHSTPTLVSLGWDTCMNLFVLILF